ncbi:ArsR/SmtB family transcription factor [Thermodesulfobacteriota bacterium]
MDQCQEKAIHLEKVQYAINNLPEPDLIQSLADIFKALSDPSRVKVVLALAACELCVCDLAAVCDLSESAVSHQLRVLRNLKIVRNRREGKIIFYRLDDNHVSSLLYQSLEHVTE